MPRTAEHWVGTEPGTAPEYEAPAPWRLKAACRGVDLTVFFPEQGGANVSTYDQARTYCARCDVLAECMADAIATGDFDGFRAGTTGSSRRRKEWPSRLTRSHKVGVRSVRDESEIADIRDGLRGVLVQLRNQTAINRQSTGLLPFRESRADGGVVA